MDQHLKVAWGTHPSEGEVVAAVGSNSVGHIWAAIMARG